MSGREVGHLQVLALHVAEYLLEQPLDVGSAAPSFRSGYQEPVDVLPGNEVGAVVAAYPLGQRRDPGENAAPLTRREEEHDTLHSRVHRR
jgi:hypothetical protein